MIARLIFASLLLVAGTAVAAPKSTVKLSIADDKTVVIRVDGKPFATFKPNYDGKLPKPFMFPVRGPGGTILTRPIERKGDDHPHHKGIWVAVDEVNGVRFWAEKGKIITRKLAKTSDHSFRVINAWQNAAGETEVMEDTTITVTPDRVLSYDITFKAGKKPVEFHDTKEGLFGFRMVNSLREKEGGKVVGSNGKTGTKALWGKPCHWIDYTGKVGGKTVGAAIFDHPKNFRPSRYHVRNYGLFSINPFGQKAYTGGKLPAQPYTLKPGESLRLRYAIYIHAGDTKSAHVNDVFKRWVHAAGH